MEMIIKEVILKYKYDNEEERNNHVEEMKKLGYEVGSKIRNTYDSIWNDNPHYFPYAEFYKIENE